METDFQTVEEARIKILSLLKPITGTRTVAIRDALDQVLAADLLSPINVPAHDNSAMDGYAFNSNCIQNADITQLKMIGTAYAQFQECTTGIARNDATQWASGRHMHQCQPKYRRV